MEDEPSPGLNRPAVVDRAVRRFAWLDLELLQERAEAYACALLADSDADGAILIVDAECNDRTLEAGIGHPRHGEEQLA
jgi:hypothetical protein